MMLRAPLLLLALTLALPAHATRTLYCSIVDKSLTLVMEGTIRDNAGEGLVSVRGDLTPLIPALSSGFGPFVLERALVTQFWFNGEELNLRLYRETKGEPQETLDLLIETRTGEARPHGLFGPLPGRGVEFRCRHGPCGQRDGLQRPRRLPNPMIGDFENAFRPAIRGATGRRADIGEDTRGHP
jgi:hypothetical protein